MSANCVDPPWSTLDDAQSNHPNPNLIPDEIGDFHVQAYCGYGPGPLEEMGPIISPIKRSPEYNRLRREAGSKAERSAAAKRPRDGCGSGSNAKSSALSKKAISQYLYVPIMQAAKELNVGLTLLKKRCRELGIRRWPHRKLTSLQTLMKNDMEGASERCAGKTREVIQILEQERRLLKEAPDVQLEDKTKRLRQAGFKVNYKKRKLLGASENGAYSDASSSNPSSYAGHRLGCGGRWV